MGRKLTLDADVSPQELQDIVDRYGEDPVRWPTTYRVPAQELIDVCAEARAIIVQAQQLRVALRNMGPDAPACFTDRIVTLALELDPPMGEVVWFCN
jgi:hypothetical protein